MTSCGSNNGDDIDTNDTTDVVQANDSTLNVRINRTQLIFHSIPSPLETANMFLVGGMDYDPELLNPIDNLSKYSTSYKEALNLGVYGADLSYASIFDQTQECMFYLNASKKLSDALGVSEAFDEATMERFETNINNRDSMMVMINECYWRTDAYFKEGERENMSALIITGGWIEGLYMGTQMMQRQGYNENVAGKIAEQKYSYDNLLGLLDTFEGDEEVKVVKDLVLKLHPLFEKIEVVDGSTSVTQNDDGSSTIGGGATLKYAKEDIEAITSTIAEVRNEITS